jgi:hypothetical protein
MEVINIDNIEQHKIIHPTVTFGPSGTKTVANDKTTRTKQDDLFSSLCEDVPYFPGYLL